MKDQILSDTTILVRLSEKTNVIYNELPSYSYAEVMSDVGGAAGLILGLNLWLILQGKDTMWYSLINIFKWWQTG